MLKQIELNKDGDALICLIYKRYCECRKDGKSIEESAFMGDDTDIQKTCCPKWPLDDVTHWCWYLKKQGLLNVMPGEDHANDVSLNDDGIYYMENRFPKGVSQVIEVLSKIAGFVTPWI